MASTGLQGSETKGTAGLRETTVLATDLGPGDVVIETGLSGIAGRITAVRVLPEVVGVTLADGSMHGLARFECCRVLRELPGFAEGR